MFLALVHGAAAAGGLDNPHHTCDITTSMASCSFTPRVTGGEPYTYAGHIDCGANPETDFDITWSGLRLSPVCDNGTPKWHRKIMYSTPTGDVSVTDNVVLLEGDTSTELGNFTSSNGTEHAVYLAANGVSYTHPYDESVTNFTAHFWLEVYNGTYTECIFLGSVSPANLVAMACPEKTCSSVCEVRNRGTCIAGFCRCNDDYYGPNCVQGHEWEEFCFDRKQSGDETGVDCGGSCVLIYGKTFDCANKKMSSAYSTSLSWVVFGLVMLNAGISM